MDVKTKQFLTELQSANLRASHDALLAACEFLHKYRGHRFTCQDGCWHYEQLKNCRGCKIYKEYENHLQAIKEAKELK